MLKRQSKKIQIVENQPMVGVSNGQKRHALDRLCADSNVLSFIPSHIFIEFESERHFKLRDDNEVLFAL